MRDEDRDLDERAAMWDQLHRTAYQPPARTPVGVGMLMGAPVVVCDDGVTYELDGRTWVALPPIPGTLADR